MFANKTPLCFVILVSERKRKHTIHTTGYQRDVAKELNESNKVSTSLQAESMAVNMLRNDAILRDEQFTTAPVW